jgi:hypothetical protein
MLGVHQGWRGDRDSVRFRFGGARAGGVGVAGGGGGVVEARVSALKASRAEPHRCTTTWEPRIGASDME